MSFSSKEAPEIDRVMKIALPQLLELMTTTEACNKDEAMPPLAGMGVALATGLIILLRTLEDDQRYRGRLVEFALLSINMILRPAGYEIVAVDQE